MKSLKVHILLVVILTGCSGSKDVELCQESWRSIFFHSIDRLANSIGIKPLNSSSDTTEIRIWEGFGLAPLKATILSKTNTGWHVATISRERPAKLIQKASGNFDDLWALLDAEGFFQLPDDCDIDGKEMYTDGNSFVVEYRKGDKYRSFLYSNPEVQNYDEAKKFMGLVKEIYGAIQ